MKRKITRIVSGLLAQALAVAFLAIPAVKLKEPALIAVLAIGVAAMVRSFIDAVREDNGT